MSEITGGELFARALQAEGIEFLFGLPSPESDPLLVELEAHGIRLIPIRHEAAGVHMAEGLYKSTGKVAAVLGNPGPGSANLLPGVLTARHEGVPVLVITSQHRLGIVYPSTPATFQGQDQLELFRPAVKWGGPIFEWGRIPEILRLAFREMWNGRPGPVHIELPAPILYETGDEDSAPVIPPASYRGPGPQPSQAQIEQAAGMLASASRPIVVSGTGVDRAGANRELLDVVELLGCPVITSMAGRSTVPSDHPNYLFGFGAAGDLAREECDVLLVVGSRVGNLDTPFDQYWGDPAGKRMIQIDIDPRHLGVTRPLQLGIVAQAGPPSQASRSSSGRWLSRPVTAPTSRVTVRGTKRCASRRRPQSSSGRGRASIPLMPSARSAPCSGRTPYTPSTVATHRCGPTRCCRRRGHAPTTRSSSSGCSGPASRRRSAASWENPAARWCA